MFDVHQCFAILGRTSSFGSKKCLESFLLWFHTKNGTGNPIPSLVPLRKKSGSVDSGNLDWNWKPETRL